MSEQFKITKRDTIIKQKNLKSFKLFYNITNIQTGQITSIPVKKEQLNNNTFKIKPQLNLTKTVKKEIPRKKLNILLNNNSIQYKGYNKTTKTFEPYNITLKSEYLDKNNINVKFANNNPWTIIINGYITGNKDQYRTIGVEHQPVGENGQPFKFIGSEDDLLEIIENSISSYLDEFNTEEITVKLAQPIQLIDNNNFKLNLSFKAIFDYQNNRKEIEDYKIEKKNKHAQLKLLYNEEIEPINNPASKNCVIYYFEQLYKKKKWKLFNTIKTELEQIDKLKKTIYLEDLKNVLDKYDITIYIYSFYGLEYEKYSVEYTETNKIGTLIIYLEDNHIYTVKNRKLQKGLTRRIQTEYKDFEVKFKDVVDLSDEFLLSNPIVKVSSNINNGTEDILFKTEEELITTNNDNINLKNIIDKMDMDVKNIICKPQTLINKLLEKYNINVYSIFPFYIPNSVLLYRNYEIEIDENDNTLLYMDKNKCFTSALFELEFIPYFNIMYHTHRPYIKDEEIKDSNIYFINLKDDANEIYFNNGYFYGWFLINYGYENIIIKDVFECEKYKNKDGVIFNPYKNLINDVFLSVDIDNEKQIEYIKLAFNAFIGQMMKPEPDTIEIQKENKTIKKNDLLNYFNKETTAHLKYLKELSNALDGIETDIDNNFTVDEHLDVLTQIDTPLKKKRLTDQIFLTWKTDILKNWNVGKDNKPLNIMIKNKAHSYILDIINKLKIKKEDIIEINTDGIYIKNSNKYNISLIKNEPQILTGWKYKYGYKKPFEPEYKEASKEIQILKYFFQNNNNKYDFNLQLAGGGKTTTIKKIIDEELKKNSKYDYIILSSYNDFLTDYRKNGYKTNTIAHYTYRRDDIKTIREKNIYVDECGVLSIDDYLFLMRHTKKNYYFYGDTLQLKPVQSNNLNNYFINYVATNINNNWTNRRNTFTKEKYIKLIENGNDLEYIEKQLTKYNTPLDNADILICYENETANKYNNVMLNKLNKSFDKNNISLDIPVINTLNGVKVINMTNEQEEIIFNRHSFKIIEKTKDNKYIIDDTINKFIIDKDNLLENFKLGYCITLYASQGKTFNNFHFLKEDINHLRKKGALYTLISRLHFSDKKFYKENIQKMINGKHKIKIIRASKINK